MLAIMQIVAYMFNMGYSEKLIFEAFQDLKTVDDVNGLYNTLGLEEPTRLQAELLLEKRHRIKSAVHVTMIRMAA